LRGAGGALFNFQSELDVYLPAAPKEFRKQKMNRSRVMHDWFDGKDLKLALYRERGHTLRIARTDCRGEADRLKANFVGTYALTIYHIESDKDVESKKLEAKGEVNCTVD